MLKLQATPATTRGGVGSSGPVCWARVASRLLLGQQERVLAGVSSAGQDTPRSRITTGVTDGTEAQAAIESFLII